MEGWPVFDQVLAAFGFVPSRTGSVISTIYGDAILPRGGAVALADLLLLTRRLGASEGVVRTAVSRLARDGVLVGRRIGRSSAYALTPSARTEFEAAVPTIYGRLDRDWDGRLHLGFPDTPVDRAAFAGFGSIAPGVVLGLDPPPPGPLAVEATGTPDSLRALVARTWSAVPLDTEYERFNHLVGTLSGIEAPGPLDAMAARTLVIHAYRRLALKTTRLPAALRPTDWPGETARHLCRTIYAGLAPLSEAWLNQVSDGSSPLPERLDPLSRFVA